MVQRLYLVTLVVACIVGLWVTYTGWTRRETAGTTALGGIAVASVLWAGCTVGLILASTPGAKLRWLQLSYVGMVAAPLAFALFAVTYTGYYQSLSTSVFVALGGIGTAFLVLIWTNPLHSLYWADIDYAASIPEGIATTPGPAFWAFVVFGYGLLFVGSTLLARYALTAPHIYRAQTAAILVAVAIPWAANIPHVLQFIATDVTPIALIVTTVALWVAMFRYRLTEIDPIALRTVFESISPGVYVLDRHDRIVDVNTAGRELFDVSEDVIGMHFQDVVPERALYEHISEDGNTEDVVTLHSSKTSGEDPANERYYEIQVTPIDASTTEYGGRVVVLTDVTATQQYQQQLEAQNDRLDQFASLVSHDLRNPLNVAGGWVELAKEECDSEYLDAIERAHGRMEVLIEDLLVLAREGEMIADLEPVELETLVDTCWDTVDTADGTVACNCDRAIRADASRLKQVFENLFRNAIDHGGDDVTVTVGQLSDGFYIEDDGPGMPEDDPEEVFEVGYSTASDGTGFGLSIAKRIVEAHGWDIHITDGSEGGARFEITGVDFVDE